MIAVKVRTTTSDPDEIGKIAEQLERSGLRVRHKMPELQIITGDLDPAHIAHIRAQAGVAGIEEEPTYQTPPFDPKKPQ